jgi:hypothetical protein
MPMIEQAVGPAGDGWTAGVYLAQGPLLSAVRRARREGLAIDDVYAPYAIHGLDEEMGIRRSRLALATLGGGIAGLLGAIALQVYCAVVDWPINVGGKPANSALAFLPIAFEATILAAALATAAAFLWRTGLHPVRRPRTAIAGLGATDDRFVLVLASGDRPATHDLLWGSGAVEVLDLPREAPA